MCNAIPILSPFFLYHPCIPHSLIIHFLVSLLFLCMDAYTKSSGFIEGREARSLKIVLLPDKLRSVNLDFQHNYLSEAGCF